MSFVWRLLVSAAAAVNLCGVCVAASQDDANPKWEQVENRMRFTVSDSAKYAVKGDEVSISEGELMVDAVANTRIKTRLSTIEAKSKSLVYVRSRAGTEHIFILLGSAPVVVDHHKELLNAGEEAVVTDHKPNYRDLVGDDDIGRRRLRTQPLVAGKHFATAEFSLIQAVEREPLIYRIFHSADSEDRLLKGRLIKTAAVLNIVTARHGQYSTGQR